MSQDKLIKKYRNKINTIINKLNKVKIKNGICENFGQSELRSFEDLIRADDALSYQNFAMLYSELNNRIDNF